MLDAMVTGVDDPETLAALARGMLRDKRPALEEALLGLMGSHQRMMLQSQLRHLDFMAEEIAQLDEEVATRSTPFNEAVRLVDDVPGIGLRTAEHILGEIGLDMGRFPTAEHLSSWAKVCPGNNESAGKRKSGRTGQGNPWLSSALTEAARAANRTKNTYLSAQYRRIAPRRGSKRAIQAVAHSIIVAIYHMLKNKTAYHDLGGHYFDNRDHQLVVRRSGQTHRASRL